MVLTNFLIMCTQEDDDSPFHWVTETKENTIDNKMCDFSSLLTLFAKMLFIVTSPTKSHEKVHITF